MEDNSPNQEDPTSQGFVFQAPRPLFRDDLEVNELLRSKQLSLNQGQAGSEAPISLLFKAQSLAIKLLLGLLGKYPALKNPLTQKIQKYKRFAPVSLKRYFKKLLRIIPNSIHNNLEGLYEFNPTHPRSLDRGFGLDTSNDPEVSIVIPVHNHFSTTFNLLQKLRLNAEHVKYEVILVDDASTDETSTLLGRIRGVSILSHRENVGYLRATNSAIPYCKGKYICLLNNDTVPESGWLDALTRTVKSDPDIAIAGSMLINSEGLVAEAGSQIFRNRQIWNLGRDRVRGNELFNFTREVDYCSAASILVDGDFLRGLNGFDERFVPAYYEDADLATTAWNKGKRVVYVHDSYVGHLEGVSHGTDTSQGLKAYQIHNGKKFWQKWEGSIDLPWELDEVSRFEADRDSRGIVVFIDNLVPSQDSNAGAKRAYKIIESLRRQKFHVVLIPDSPEIQILNRERLRRSGVEVYQSYEGALQNLKLRENRIIGFWISRFDVAETVLPKVKAAFPGKEIYFDTVDIHHLRDNRNILLNGEESAIYSDNIEKRELEICAKSSKVIVVAEYEKNYLLEKNPNLNIVTFFMPEEIPAAIGSESVKDYILFVGSFEHTPNVDAVEWLINEILPLTKIRDTQDMKVKIVGSSLPASLQRQLEGKNCEYLGWQESLTEIYAGARMVVVPLRYGAGKKGKVSEALANSCAVISTSVGVEGYNLDDRTHFILADSAAEFAFAIDTLWEDARLVKEISENGRTKIISDSGLVEFDRSVAEVLGIDRS
jgi:GT2 family glycosyltransferase